MLDKLESPDTAVLQNGSHRLVRLRTAHVRRAYHQPKTLAFGTVRIIDQVKTDRVGHLVTANDFRALLLRRQGIQRFSNRNLRFRIETGGRPPVEAVHARAAKTNQREGPCPYQKPLPA